MKYQLGLIFIIICIIIMTVAYQLRIASLKEQLSYSISQTDRAIDNSVKASSLIDRRDNQVLQLIEMVKQRDSVINKYKTKESQIH